MTGRTATSAERLQAALSHREPDRIPLDIGGTRMSGIHRAAYRRYLDRAGLSGLDPDPALSDRNQQLARLPEPVLRHLGVDVRGIFPVARPVVETGGDAGDPADPRDESFRDEWGIGWRRPGREGFYFDVDACPYADTGPEAARSAPVPDGGAPFRFARMAEDLDRANGLEAGLVLNGFCSGALELVTRLIGYEDALVDLVTDPDRVGGWLDRIVEAKMQYWEKALRLSAGRAAVAVEVDDLGTQQGLLMSRELYRSVLMPRHRRLFSFIRQCDPGVRIFFHTCGSVREVLPDLIDAGVDILNPVQTSAAGMDPAALKREFGRDLVFWGGGVDTQRILPFGTPGEVREDVRRRIDLLAPGGGFVFATIHNIQPDVPPENLEALLDALRMSGAG